MSDVTPETYSDRLQSPDDIVQITAAETTCRYPNAICDQLRWLQRRVFYQFMQTGCPTIDLEADLSVERNQADLTERLAVPVPILRTMPVILRGSVRHRHKGGDPVPPMVSE